MPKVSICIPAYSQIFYLKKTIDSVLTQTYNDYEIVITDDSPGNIVKDLVLDYNLPDRIKYYKNESVLGSPENWNEAIRRSAGEYIKILHHDDWLNSKDSLAKYVQLLDQHPDVDLAFSATQVKSTEGNDWVHRISTKDVENIQANSLNLFTHILIGAPSAVIFRKNTNLFFDRHLKWLVDMEFYLRQLNRNPRTAFCPDLLVVTFGAEGRVTDECANNKTVEVFEYFYTLQTIFNRKKRYGGRPLIACIIKAICICEKYGVTNKREVRACGYNGNIPALIHIYFVLANGRAFMGRYFIKFLRRLLA